MPRELALFTIVLFTALLATLGGKLITLFGFGIFSLRENRRKPAKRSH
jgi:hypothetical protein